MNNYPFHTIGEVNQVFVDRKRITKLAGDNQKRKLPYTNSIHPLVFIVGLPVLIVMGLVMLFVS